MDDGTQRIVGPASPRSERIWSMKFLQFRLQKLFGWILGFVPHQITEGISSLMAKKNDTRSCDDTYYLHDLSPIGPNSDGDINKVQNFIYSVGIEKTADVKCDILYTSLESRLKTFEKCKQELSQAIFSFCKAGFYYIGDGTNDRMVCFSCQQGLMKWQKDDNPWVEHARWSKHCSFVLLSMGKRFVKEISDEENIPKCNLEELQAMITIHKNHTSSPERNSKTNIIVKTNDQIELVPQRNVRTAQKNSVVPDAMLCKICFKEKLEVMFIPCGHLTACIQCAMTLDLCAICRYPFKMLIKVYIDLNERQNDSLNQPNPTENSVLCKVCHENQIGVTFIPCRHVCICFDCAAITKKCPICSDTFFAYIQVYL